MPVTKVRPACVHMDEATNAQQYYMQTSYVPRFKQKGLLSKERIQIRWQPYKAGPALRGLLRNC